MVTKNKTPTPIITEGKMTFLFTIFLTIATDKESEQLFLSIIYL
jgi:hypothetical protein